MYRRSDVLHFKVLRGKLDVLHVINEFKKNVDKHVQIKHYQVEKLYFFTVRD